MTEPRRELPPGYQQQLDQGYSFGSVQTFGQRPLLTEVSQLDEWRPDVAVIGAPFDLGTTNRPGARFGPRALRSSAYESGTYHLGLGLDIFDQLPIGNLAIKYELFDAQGLESARTAVRLLVVARLALLVGFFLLAALGIWLSADRRRTVARWGFGVALATGIVAGLIGFLAAYSVDNVPANGPPPDAAKALLDAGLHFLRLSFRATIALGLVIALVATLAGPGRVAVRTRALLRAGLSRTPAPESGPFPTWVAAHRTPLRVGGVVVALVGLLLWSAPGAVTVLVAALLLAIWVLGIEVIARGAAAPAAAGAASDPA